VRIDIFDVDVDADCHLTDVRGVLVVRGTPDHDHAVAQLHFGVPEAPVGVDGAHPLLEPERPAQPVHGRSQPIGRVVAIATDGSPTFQAFEDQPALRHLFEREPHLLGGRLAGAAR
jgi:hypothetical protein